MEEEKEQLKDILFFKQYLPRVLAYALIGCNSSKKAEIQKGKELRDEAASYKWTILFSSKASLVSKIKLVILLLPTVLRKRVAGIYIVRSPSPR